MNKRVKWGGEWKHRIEKAIHRGIANTKDISKSYMKIFYYRSFLKYMLTCV